MMKREPWPGPFVTLVERNEWEGETWRFHLPVVRNSHALEELRHLLRALPEELRGDFELDTTPLTEAQVDALVAQDDDETTYLAAHTKLAGRLELPPSERRLKDDWLHDAPYKGGIQDMMKMGDE